jgi:putative oxidoreductase
MARQVRLADTPATLEDWGTTILRVVTGTVFMVHGWQKLFEFGVGNVAQTFGSMGIPAPHAAAMVVSTLEFFGGAALILGLLTRWVSVPLTVQMAVAVLAVHLSKGFFVDKGGYEFALMMGTASAALVLLRPGALAVDNLLARRGAHWVRPSHRLSRARI